MILDKFKLDGKVAIVTGSNQGIGQMYAVALAEAGADVIGISYVDDFSETEKLIKPTGRKFEILMCAIFLNANLCMSLLNRLNLITRKLISLLTTQE